MEELDDIAPDTKDEDELEVLEYWRGRQYSRQDHAALFVRILEELALSPQRPEAHIDACGHAFGPALTEIMSYVFLLHEEPLRPPWSEFQARLLAECTLPGFRLLGKFPRHHKEHVLRDIHASCYSAGFYMLRTLCSEKRPATLRQIRDDALACASAGACSAGDYVWELMEALEGQPSASEENYIGTHYVDGQFESVFEVHVRRMWQMLDLLGKEHGDRIFSPDERVKVHTW